MEKTYDPKAIENKRYQLWEHNGYFSPSGQGTSYTIMIPPPNVTGSLHMGHAFQDALMDAFIRYHRMCGFNTLWQVGTDHAGIATQMVVERQLAEKGQSRHELGRENFLSAMWHWKKTSGNRITQQLRRLGASVDWKTERFTMDEGFNHAVTQAFVTLYQDNLIYRGKRLVNWDPKLQTAISDLEVENKEIKGHMWYVRYPLANGITTLSGQNYIVIATTRPETILGDTGVAVNPNDPRYTNLIGKSIDLPLMNRQITIIADNHADMTMGSGCVKITPAHDFNDYEVGKRCGLPMINIMTLNGCIRDYGEAYEIETGKPVESLNTTIPAEYHGLERFEARKKIIAQLKADNLLDRIEDHNLKVPYGDRSQVIIEPLLTDQWFVRTKPLAEPAIKLVKEGHIQFIPKQYENMYYAWMNDIQDWCISRQLWWGHQIPAWYDKQGTVYVGNCEEEIRQANNLSKDIELTRDNDVLDTWFSSALWSFTTLGWPDTQERLKTFRPTDVLVTGFDIIFFWVARMIMMTHYLLKELPTEQTIPFRKIYITGLIRDEQGQKMSKSKGNVIDPLDMIDGISLDELIKKRTNNLMQPQLATKITKSTRGTFPKGIPAYGTDALRYTLYSLASTGRDINWDMKRLEGYRNFCNKLWNATNYVLLNLQESNYATTALPTQENLALPERWILSKLQHLLINLKSNISQFRLDHATQNLYDFSWNEYCSWYIELSKPTLWNKTLSSAQKTSTLTTLVTILEIMMRSAHPFIPFITEEIWQSIKPFTTTSGESIMNQAFPEAVPDLIDKEAEQDMDWVKGFITCIRNIRSELKGNQQATLSIILHKTSERDRTLTQQNEKLLLALSRSDSIKILNNLKEKPQCIMQLLGDMEILVPMEGLIDTETELLRLSHAITKLDMEMERVENKLNNANFVKNAPATIVEKEKQKLLEATQSKKLLTQQQQDLQILKNNTS